MTERKSNPTDPPTRKVTFFPPSDPPPDRCPSFVPFGTCVVCADTRVMYSSAMETRMCYCTLMSPRVRVN